MSRSYFGYPVLDDPWLACPPDMGAGPLAAASSGRFVVGPRRHAALELSCIMNPWKIKAMRGRSPSLIRNQDE